jgi:hypothetical protein
LLSFFKACFPCCPTRFKTALFFENKRRSCIRRNTGRSVPRRIACTSANVLEECIAEILSAHNPVVADLYLIQSSVVHEWKSVFATRCQGLTTGVWYVYQPPDYSSRCDVLHVESDLLLLLFGQKRLQCVPRYRETRPTEAFYGCKRDHNWKQKRHAAGDNSFIIFVSLSHHHRRCVTVSDTLFALVEIHLFCMVALPQFCLQRVQIDTTASFHSTS